MEIINIKSESNEEGVRKTQLINKFAFPLIKIINSPLTKLINRQEKKTY